jgi:hypothetical protein
MCCAPGHLAPLTPALPRPLALEMVLAAAGSIGHLGTLTGLYDVLAWPAGQVAGPLRVPLPKAAPERPISGPLGGTPLGLGTALTASLTRPAGPDARALKLRSP